MIKLLEGMRVDLTGKIASRKLTQLSKKRLQLQLESANDLIDSYYKEIAGGISNTLTAVGIGTGKHVAKLYDITIPTNNKFKLLVSDLLIQGAPSKDWWTKQSETLKFKFASAVRQGIAQAETVDQVTRRVNTEIDVGIRDARTLVNTSIQTVANKARLLTFEENSDVLQGVQQLSTFDGHTSDICISYSGAKWNIPDYEPIGGNSLPFNGGPPRHFNCRSVLIPLTRLRSVRGKRASEFGEIDKSTTFDEFLKRKTITQQDEMLGKGRAQLWRNGKITLRDLLNQDGNPLTLAQLAQRYD